MMKHPFHQYQFGSQRIPERPCRYHMICPAYNNHDCLKILDEGDEWAGSDDCIPEILKVYLHVKGMSWDDIEYYFKGGREE